MISNITINMGASRLFCILIVWSMFDLGGTGTEYFDFRFSADGGMREEGRGGRRRGMKDVAGGKGGLEEDWRRTGGGLEKDWRRIGKQMFDRFSIDVR